jgi:hypothetical protein
MENQMTLHHNKELFSELITRTSEMLKMPEIYIEKDYWVTYILFALSQMDADIQTIEESILILKGRLQ